MSEDHKRQLEQQLWNIANTLRGKMDADEFRDYILGFIFYKYLSEKMRMYADEILKEDKMAYLDISETRVKSAYDPIFTNKILNPETIHICKPQHNLLTFFNPALLR